MTVEQIPGGDIVTEESTIAEEVLDASETVQDTITEVESGEEHAPDTETESEAPPADDEPGVSKARREAAGYRTKLRAAEAANSALRDQLIGMHLASANGVTIKALEAAGIDLNTLVGEDGTVSVEAVNEAAATTRTTLGIPNNRFTGTADQGTRYRQSAPAVQPSWGNLIAQ